MKKYQLLIVISILTLFLLRHDFFSFYLLKNIISVQALQIFLSSNTKTDTQKTLYLYNKMANSEAKKNLRIYIERLLAVNTKFTSANHIIDNLISNNDTLIISLFQQLTHDLNISQQDILKQITKLLPSKKVYYSDVHSNNVSLHYTTCDQFQLVSVYISEKKLELDQRVPIILVWKKMSLSQSKNDYLLPIENWSFFEYENTIFQIGYQENLLFDGGFERTLSPQRPGLTLTLPNLVYPGQKEEQFSLIYDPPYEVKNIILRTINKNSSVKGIGLSSNRYLNTLANQKIFIIGRYRSSHNADPRIGVTWYREDLKATHATYIIDKPSTEWITYAGLIDVPSKAKTYQYRVSHFSPNTTLDVDNLGMFIVPSLCSVFSP
jgi:hypothetical protein